MFCAAFWRTYRDDDNESKMDSNIGCLAVFLQRRWDIVDTSPKSAGAEIYIDISRGLHVTSVYTVYIGLLQSSTCRVLSAYNSVVTAQFHELSSWHVGIRRQIEFKIDFSDSRWTSCWQRFNTNHKSVIAKWCTSNKYLQWMKSAPFNRHFG